MTDLFKRLAVIFAVVGLLIAGLMLFTYDVIKIQWVGFMQIQPSYLPMEDPLPVPDRSIPVEGPASIPNMGAPVNPIPSDDTSLARGKELYTINCAICHGESGKGNGPAAAFLQNKPLDLTSPLVLASSDGSIFMTISNGVPGRMPPLNENLTVRERWDVINYVRTLKPAQ